LDSSNFDLGKLMPLVETLKNRHFLRVRPLKMLQKCVFLQYFCLKTVKKSSFFDKNQRVRPSKMCKNLFFFILFYVDYCKKLGQYFAICIWIIHSSHKNIFLNSKNNDILTLNTKITNLEFVFAQNRGVHLVKGPD
jgi:hypothetical protein